MSIAYERVNWEDSPSTATPLNAENLNKMDTAISDLSNTMNELDDGMVALADRVSSIEEAEGLHRYGVSGIGQSAASLTRLWDAVGMTAQVGTDADNSNVINNFDDVTPFNRRKCVGRWHNVNGKAVFHPEAYLGDEDYTEDGSKGNYVAVECPRAYYYLKDGILGVSAHQYEGWRPFDIFCHDHNQDDTMPFYYAPAYALSIDENGHAVSLPGYANEHGSYKQLVDAARTYDDGALGKLAMLSPMTYNFYEWALFTVEFATQNCQAVMRGCSDLRHSNDDYLRFIDATHAVTNNYYTSRVVGEYIAVIGSTVDTNSASYKATHKILSITRCDETGVYSESGSHQLLELEDLGREYYTYDTSTEYRFAPRPYYTGSCNGVSTPSGSPVNNTSGYYPMKYRWHENAYSNQNKTVMDLFAMRVGTSEDDYSLEWYYLPDPSLYEPGSSSKPDATDLASSMFEKIMETDREHYASGYIVSKQNSDEYPDVRLPYETVKGSATTYYADYAFLVYSYVVRAVRLLGDWSSGSLAGFSIVFASNAPSSGNAYSGGDLFFIQ